jgi:hypothetical protein
LQLVNDAGEFMAFLDKTGNDMSQAKRHKLEYRYRRRTCWSRFARDSPLEEAVRSEPVSEMGLE